MLAILACTPYIALKIHWLMGGRLGLNDPEFGHSTAMVVANAMTLAFEIVAIALAVAFVAPWGRRLPAAVVLVPMWVGCGLLGGVLTLVATVLIMALAGIELPGLTGGSSAAVPPIDGWVFMVVYLAFSLLGVCLISGFALYARDRWLRPGGFLSSMSEARSMSVSRRWAAFGLAGVTLVSTVGAGLVSTNSIMGAAIETGRYGVWGLLTALGLVALGSRRPGRLPVAWPASVVFVGSGALAAWGLYSLVLELVPNDLTGGMVATAPMILWDASRVVVGLAAVLLLRWLTPRGSV